MSHELPDPVHMGLPTHLRVAEPLGSGGTGSVWKARDTRRGRDVALKVLDTTRAGTGDRLEREVRALARLHDVAGVVAVHECGHTESGVSWLVTELIPGESLAERSRRGPMDAPAAIELAARLFGTISVAHDRGIAHGDITPGNVLLDTRGRPHLVDLGLAWLGEDASGGGCTPAYSPPERLRGAPASPAADVYSLGATVSAVAAGDMPPVLHACMHDRPSRRPGAAQAAAELRAHRGGGGRSPSVRWRGPRPRSGRSGRS